MNTYNVVFYYKDYPSAEFTWVSETRLLAENAIKAMVKARDSLIPGNWDRYEIVNQNQVDKV